MKRFILTPRAKQDVNDIWDYIANDNFEAADRVLEALEVAMFKLAKSPDIGHWREELTDKRHRFFWSIRIWSSIGTKPSHCR
jgi:plasmid stabilization system protein ParE